MHSGEDSRVCSRRCERATVELLRDVWDGLVDSGASVGLTPEQQRELDQRLQQHREFPDDVISWEQARSEIERPNRTWSG